MPAIKRVRLTANRVANLRCPQGQKQCFLWDSEVVGFGCRVTSTGSKAFVVQGRRDGKSERRTLKATQLDTAREEARVRLSKISMGIDPDADEERAVQARAEEEVRKAAADITLQTLWTLYIEDRRQFWGHRHYLDHVRLAQSGTEPAKRGGTLQPGPLAPLMGNRLADLTSDRLEDWLEQEAAKRPTQTRLAFGLLKTFVGWCAEHSVYGAVTPDLPALVTRRVNSLLPKKGIKDDVLQKEQLNAWFRAVQQMGNQIIGIYLQVLLLTGARREELGTLEWGNVDFKWKSITIHDKVEGLRVIPLTPYVETLLHRLPRVNRWVFSSNKSASGRITEPRIAHNKALVIAGIADLTLHGLRRSFASLGEWVEMPIGVVAQIMGHKPSATAERHYKRRPLDLLRQWHKKYESWILAQAGIDVLPRQQQGEAPLRLVVGGR